MHHSIRNPFSVDCERRTTCREKMTPAAHQQHSLLTWLLDSGTPVSFFEFGALRWEQLI
jgi:hypothetical protein